MLIFKLNGTNARCQVKMVRMVDVGDKPIQRRKAVARARILMRAGTLAAIHAGEIPKGDVVATARLAGILGAKQCPQLLPLCHPLPLDSVKVDIRTDEECSDSALDIRAECSTRASTGVEMEALAACSAAALCIYDMCKSEDPGMRIVDLRLLYKEGGKSGVWRQD